MDNAAIATIVSSGLSLAGVWALLRWPYRHHRLDAFRNELFEIRGELFDIGASGAVAFDSPAYARLRTMLNGFLRFAEGLSMGAVICNSVAFSRDDARLLARDQPREQWITAVSELPDGVARQLRSIERKMLKAVVLQILIGSPIVLLAVVVTVFPVLILIIAWFLARDLMRDRLETAAFVAGGNSARVPC